MLKIFDGQDIGIAGHGDQFKVWLRHVLLDEVRSELTGNNFPRCLLLGYISALEKRATRWNIKLIDFLNNVSVLNTLEGT